MMQYHETLSDYKTVISPNLTTFVQTLLKLETDTAFNISSLAKLYGMTNKVDVMRMMSEFHPECFRTISPPSSYQNEATYMVAPLFMLMYEEPVGGIPTTHDMTRIMEYYVDHPLSPIILASGALNMPMVRFKRLTAALLSRDCLRALTTDSGSLFYVDPSCFRNFRLLK